MKKILGAILLCAMVSVLGCTQAATTPVQSEPAITQSAATAQSSTRSLPAQDASGTDKTIVSLAPSLTRSLIDLGLSSQIIGCDTNSAGLPGLKPDIPEFDMMSPDVEKLIELHPDLVLASNLSFYDKSGAYKPLTDSGTEIAEVPTPENIEGIKESVAYIASLFNAQAQGDKILNEFDAKLKEFETITAKIPESQRKTVYFEISAAPDMYTTGGGTYLNEMIELAGGINIFADKDGWMPVSGEAVIEADPDVIFTNVDYLDDPIDEILSRKGWVGVKAIKNEQVFQIDKDSSSEPNEDIVKALTEMASALYPEFY